MYFEIKDIVFNFDGVNGSKISCDIYYSKQEKKLIICASEIAHLKAMAWPVPNDSERVAWLSIPPVQTASHTIFEGVKDKEPEQSIHMDINPKELKKIIKKKTKTRDSRGRFK